MFYKKYNFFSQLARSHPFLKHVDIFDSQSTIRAYFLDNNFLCVLTYLVFYLILWYANHAIRRIEKSSEEMLYTVERNKHQLNDLLRIQSKRKEFEDVVIKVRSAQKATVKYLKNEMKRLGMEIAATANKLRELEDILEQCKLSERFREGFTEDIKNGRFGAMMQSPSEELKIVEPSFPPSPKEPPRKYGIFVSRPPGRKTSMFPAATTAPAGPPAKIKLK